LRPLEEVAYIEKTDEVDVEQSPDLSTLAENYNLELQGSLMIDYIFLDGPERRKFAQSAHEYLIDQVQYYIDNSTSQEVYSIRLDFNHPVKEIIWVTQKNARLINERGDIEIQWTNYGVTDSGKKNPVLESKLEFNGYERVLKEHGNFYNYVRPHYHHSNTPADGINLYSFSVFPEEHQQPSGACNFSRIPNALLSFKFDSAMFTHSVLNTETDEVEVQDTTIKIWIFGINYNVLRLVGGFGALAFA
jgi:hypothetical protein